MDKTLFKFIWHYSKSQQFTTLGLTLASFPFLYTSLQLPKVIINDAIGGDAFPQEYLGIALDQISYLLILCLILLALLVINAVFQMSINTYKGIMAERMLRRLRNTLYGRILRFPLRHFQKVSPGELSSMITAEVEPLGEFIGDSFAMPLFQGGTMVTILVFMFAQDWGLGLLAVSLIPVQAYVIPILQRQVNALGKERVRRARVLSGRIGESATGINDVHANAASPYMLAQFSRHLGGIFNVRFKLYKKKFFMKALNNFLSQMTPLLFYSFGGVLIVNGNLSLGSLVAVITAYSRFSTPWRVLLKYYQRMQDAKIKYEVLIEQFDTPDIPALENEQDSSISIPRLTGPLEFHNVSLTDEFGIEKLKNISFRVHQGSRLALVAGAGVREKIALLLIRLTAPSKGKIVIGGENLANMQSAVTGLRIGYAGPDSYVFSGTIRDNILFGVNRPPKEMENLSEDRIKEREEAIASGNSTANVDLDWTDYKSLGIRDQSQLYEWILKVAHGLEIYDQLYDQALSMTIDPEQYPQIANGVKKAHDRFSKILREDGALTDLVHPFDFEKYNTSSSVHCNIIFGEPVMDIFTLDKFCKDGFIQSVLDHCDLTRSFQEMGLQVAKIMIEMFCDLADDDQTLIERYSFADEDSLKGLKSLTLKAEDEGFDSLTNEETGRLMSLTMQLVVDRHRLGIIDKEMQEKIVRARKVFRETLPDDLKDAIAFFDGSEFNGKLSLRRNLLGGGINHTLPNAEDTINAVTLDIIKELNLLQPIIMTTMESDVGIGGRGISQSGRQRITLARSIVKRPDILVINDALSTMERDEQDRIRRNIFNLLPEATMIWITGEKPDAPEFDQTVVIKQGRVSEQIGGEKIEPTALPEEIESEIELGEATEFNTETAILKKIPLFTGMDSSSLKLLAFTSERITYKKGQILLKEGKKGAFAYVILKGRSKIVVGGDETFIRDVKEHELIGEMSLLTSNPIGATVIAISDLTVLQLKKETFLELMSSDRNVSFSVARVLSDKLFRATQFMRNSK